MRVIAAVSTGKGTISPMNPEELLAHAGFVRALSRRLVLDENRAADIEQDTWLAALNEASGVKGSIRAWLSQVARNFALMAFRSDKSRRTRERAAAARTTAASAEEQIIHAESLRSMTEAVLQLSDPYRTAILLRFYEGLTLQQVADRVGIPLGTAKTHQKRALEKLRTLLDVAYGGKRKTWCLALGPFAGRRIAEDAVETSMTSVFYSGVVAISMKVKVGLVAVAVLASSLVLWHIWPEDGGLLPDQERSIAHTEPDSPIAKEPDRTGPESDGAERETIAVEPVPDGITLVGKVLARADAAPIDGASVTVATLPVREGDRTRRSATTARGEFRLLLHNPQEGELECLHIRISAKGFKDLETALPLPAEAATTECGPFFLHANRIHTVRIIDAARQPVPGARLELFKKDKDRPFVSKIADGEGLVTVPDDEIEWSTWLWTDSLLRVTAAGKADFLSRIDDLKAPPADEAACAIPREIRLDEAGFETAKVLDRETGAGLGGVQILFRQNQLSLWAPVVETWRVRTDNAGYFQVPRYTVDRGHFLELVANSVGYLPFTGSYDEGADNIEMERAALIKTAQVVDSTNRHPLAGLDLTVRLDFRTLEVSTDAAGRFECPFPANRKSFVTIRAFGYRPCSIRSFDPNSLGSRPWFIELEPQTASMTPLEIKAVDELARPVAGARVQISYHYAKDGSCFANNAQFTGLDGIACFHPASIPGTFARLGFEALGFCPLDSEPIELDEETNGVRTYVLKRGILFQNIRVVDETGVPVPGQIVVAMLNLDSGGQTFAGGFSDSRGFCDIAFPLFDTGTIGVQKREDTFQKIQYASLLGRDWIPIVLPQNADGAPKIEGVVQDSEENPLGGVVLNISKADDKSEQLSRMIVTEKKRFLFGAHTI